MPDIEHWLRKQWQEHATPFYASVDLRNSGFKLAPVDTNLFPGGFNNLNPRVPAAVRAGDEAAVEKICPGRARRAAHPREPHAQHVLPAERRDARRASCATPGCACASARCCRRSRRRPTIELPDGGKLTLEPIERKGNRLVVDGFDPCVVLLNNDLSAGMPADPAKTSSSVCCRRCTPAGRCAASRTISKLTKKSRRSSRSSLGIDPWLINPYFEKCGGSISSERKGEECLEGMSPKYSTDIAPSTREYGIEQSRS